MIQRTTLSRDDHQLWRTSHASAARIPAARSPADETPAISRSATATANISRSDCSTATPASPGSPNVKALRFPTPACRRKEWSPSCNIWSRATGSVRPSGSPASTATPSCGWPAWPESTPAMPTTNSWPFPPETREIQLDEMWSFVAKKQANCDPDDPADDHKGDWWDHVVYDAEHRLVLAVVPGAHSIETAEHAVGHTPDRTAAREDVLVLPA